MHIDSIRSDAVRNIAQLTGRALMSALFIWSGYGKLVAPADTEAYFASIGLPFPELARVLAVFVELGGGLALLLGLEARLVAVALAVWCILTALAGHSDFADATARIQFMKNVSMAGGFIFIASFGAGAYTAKAVMPRFRWSRLYRGEER